LRETAQHLPLDLTIEGVTIFYRNRPYRFTRAIDSRSKLRAIYCRAKSGDYSCASRFDEGIELGIAG
jgi:hypothetical protein